MNAVEIEQAISELALQPFDPAAPQPFRPPVRAQAPRADAQNWRDWWEGAGKNRSSGKGRHVPAEVEVVATYKLHNINRTKLENLFHRLFSAAQIDLTIEDRFGQPVKPREWFLVPLQAIDEAVQCIRDGSITKMAYDPATARLVARAS